MNVPSVGSVLRFLSSREHLLDQPLPEGWKCTIELKGTSGEIVTTLTLTPPSASGIARLRRFILGTYPSSMSSVTILTELDTQSSR